MPSRAAGLLTSGFLPSDMPREANEGQLQDVAAAGESQTATPQSESPKNLEGYQISTEPGPQGSNQTPDWLPRSCPYTTHVKLLTRGVWSKHGHGNTSNWPHPGPVDKEAAFHGLDNYVLTESPARRANRTTSKQHLAMPKHLKQHVPSPIEDN